MTTITRIARTLFASTAAVALTFAIGASPAFADGNTTTTTMTYTSAGDGLTGVIPGPDGTRLPAMSYLLDSEGTAVYAYCVQFGVLIDESAKWTPTAFGSSGVNNIAKAADLAVRHNEIGTPYSDARWEAAATQTAIWVLTNGVDPSTVGNTGFTTRVNALVAAATDRSEPTFATALAVTSATNELGEVVVTVTATVGGSPASGQVVKVTVEDTSFSGVTDGTGVAKVTVPARYAGKEAKVSATTTAAAGMFLAASTGQSLVTSSAAPVTSTVTATLATTPAPPTPAPTTAAPVPAPTVAPSPEMTALVETPEAVVVAEETQVPTAEVTPSKKPKNLPHTGSDVSPVWLFGLLAVAGLGVGGFLYSRRTHS